MSFLANLQVARFLAAIMVLVHHLELELATPRLNSPFRDPVGIEWSIGVDVFFMVSGFIMYLLSRQRFAEPGYAAEFLRRRLVRVVPLYWLFTGLMIASILASPGAVNHADLSAGRVLGSYLFFPWPRAGGDIYPILGLGWTLNYEIEFYLAFTLALCLPLRRGLTGLVGAFLLACLVGAILPRDWIALRFWTDPIILEFLAGIGFAHLYSRGLRLSAPWRWAAILLGLSLSAATTHLGLVDAIPRPLWGGLPAACMFAGLCLGEQPSKIGPVLRMMVLGGDASYALYLSHMFSIRALSTVWPHLQIASPLIYLCCGLALATAVAIAVHLLIERPLLGVLRRLMGKWDRRGGEPGPLPGG
ncbi:acyltransferase [Phenylobacterium sp. 20VBR1]|uniref:Acyltransferase n=1 Tax=Phenylobacterium glaciei TaxID=2803784 RepID=A0A941D0F0_9CAUL|nr:acyltransferase [Phenylobacterium glaciei]MBR7619222.1 acyltransferase [Phenylobacterium glaciei]